MAPIQKTPIAARVAAKFLEASDPVLNQDFWISREEMSAICPPCANRMASLKIRRVLASAIFGQDVLQMAGEETADKWKKMPKGWNSKSRKKLWDSLGGSVSSCVGKMEGKVDDAGAYCGSLADRVKGKTSWRGPD
jgi:hypothetical protein